MGSVTARRTSARPTSAIRAQVRPPAEWLRRSVQRHELTGCCATSASTSPPGEAVGIVGANGAGKSTLLKLITGTIAPPTALRASTGAIAALLELGIGFHPEFTGRAERRTWPATCSACRPPRSAR